MSTIIPLAMPAPSDERQMQGPAFAMFLLLTGQHPDYRLVSRVDALAVAEATSTVARVA